MKLVFYIFIKTERKNIMIYNFFIYIFISFIYYFKSTIIKSLVYNINYINYLKILKQYVKAVLSFLFILHLTFVRKFNEL